MADKKLVNVLEMGKAVADLQKEIARWQPSGTLVSNVVEIGKLRSFTEAMEVFGKQVDEFAAKNATILQELERFRVQLAEAKEQEKVHVAVVAELSELQRDMQQANHKIAELTDSVAAGREAIRELRAQTKRDFQTIEDLTARVTEGKRAVAVLDALRNNLPGMPDRIGELVKKLDMHDAVQESSSLADQLRDKAAQVAELQLGKESALGEAARLTGVVDELRGQLAQATERAAVQADLLALSRAPAPQG